MIHKHFKTKAKFNEEYAASRIADSDICFIKDTGEIWTHGVFYAKVEASTTNGNIKINGTETTVYTHPSGTNPHGTTKSDVGLGNVGNFKAVSTAASQGLSDTEKSNARANIGAGTGNGTITGIKMNGASKGSSGVVDLGTVITSHQDISGKANKSTTLSGYGITDAYTKTEIDNMIGNIETLLAAI